MLWRYENHLVSNAGQKSSRALVGRFLIGAQNANMSATSRRARHGNTATPSTSATILGAIISRTSIGIANGQPMEGGIAILRSLAPIGAASISNASRPRSQSRCATTEREIQASTLRSRIVAGPEGCGNSSPRSILSRYGKGISADAASVVSSYRSKSNRSITSCRWRAAERMSRRMCNLPIDGVTPARALACSRRTKTYLRATLGGGHADLVAAKED